MQLVLVALGSRAAFHIADIGPFVGHNQRALKLARTFGVDTEIGAQLHRTAHPLGDVAEGAVAEDRRVEGGKEIVAGRHHATQILLHQVGMLLHSLADGHEDNAFLFEGLLTGGFHADGIHDGVVGHLDLSVRLTGFFRLGFTQVDAGQRSPLAQRDAQFVESRQQLGVDIVHAFLLLLLGCGIIDDVLVVHLLVVEMRPVGLLHLLPATERLQTELQQPFGFALLLGNETDHILVEALANGVGGNVGNKAPLVLFVGYFVDYLITHEGLRV